MNAFLIMLLSREKMQWFFDNVASAELLAAHFHFAIVEKPKVKDYLALAIGRISDINNIEVLSGELLKQLPKELQQVASAIGVVSRSAFSGAQSTLVVKNACNADVSVFNDYLANMPPIFGGSIAMRRRGINDKHPSGL